jgi:hypothetical protein
VLARPFERLRLVGRPAPGRVRRIKGRAQPPVAEHLRRERPPQAATLNGFGNYRIGARAAVCALEGIRRGRREQSSNRVRGGGRQ